MSLSARRAWIEIREEKIPLLSAPPSLSARRAWIEIKMRVMVIRYTYVALRKESVDRNFLLLQVSLILPVALRKESVDRNWNRPRNSLKSLRSLSARRAWIEISYIC